jgi:transcriptional regulator with XRE-family HTH domain
VAGRDDIRAFLTSRRASIQPDDVGLRAPGSRRRVPGLRREEVALLAGVSVEYYAQLERGRARGVSDDVLLAVADALRLDDDEVRHLFDLVRSRARVGTRRRSIPMQVRPGVQRTLDAIRAPAIVRNRRLDIVGSNCLGRALCAPMFASATGCNIARFAFLDPSSRDFFTDWANGLDDVVAVLRAEAGRNLGDQVLIDLVRELSSHSDEFRVRWERHDVKLHRDGPKQIRHPVIGELTVVMEVFDLASDAGLTLMVLLPEPASASAPVLARLAASARHSITDNDNNHTDNDGEREP